MATTVKVSTETRDRIKSFGGDTMEATIVDALDALEEQQFWARAERAAAALRALPPDELARRKAAEAAVDRAFDAVD